MCHGKIVQGAHVLVLILFITMIGIANTSAQGSQFYLLAQPNDFILSDGWTLLTESGVSILRGAINNKPGSVASVSFSLPTAAECRIWVNARDYPAVYGARNFHVAIDGKQLAHEYGTHGANAYAWEGGAPVFLEAGTHQLQILDTGGYYVRLREVLVTSDSSFYPSTLTLAGLAGKGLLQRVEYKEPAWLRQLGANTRIELTSTTQPVGTLTNTIYTITVQPNGTFIVTHRQSGFSATFSPDFQLFFGQQNPSLEYVQVDETRRTSTALGYRTAAWKNEADLFKAPGWHTLVTATNATLEGSRVIFHFPQPVLSAQLALPLDDSEPVLSFHLTAPDDGYYTIGFGGAPSLAANQADWIWQPLVWQGKRFPLKPYLTEEARATIPAVLMGVGGYTIGVAADPKESPFRLPTQENSRFGVAIRNATGQAQPMLFAPIYGGEGSFLANGTDFTFSMRLVVQPGDWYSSYKQLATGLYDFHDYRQNGLTTLNQTLDNLVDFIMNDQYSYWYPEYKTNGYQNDKPGYGRQQSAADALALAFVRDSQEIYQRRALPTIEYMVSRRTLYMSLGKYDAANGMGGPVPGNIVDFTALYLMSGERSTVFRQLAEKLDPTLRFALSPLFTYNRERALDNARMNLRDLIAYYRLTGDQHYLDMAKKAADDYITWRITTPPTDFYEVQSTFWYDIGPIWDALYELYRVTGEQKYLDATVAGVQQFTGFVNLQPMVPDENVIVNQGGVVRGMQAPEEEVPAWRVSANGLTTEAANTSHSHRGIFMAPYAGMMARLAYEGNDTFFSDIARSAVIGRYSNYPSYAYRYEHTTVNQYPDYPLRPFEELTYTTEHYNHPLPQALFLIDFLVSDVYARSKGSIDFPARYTSTSAYFHNHIYGDRPGTFYGDEEVWLWLPKALLQSDHPQVNYVAGYGNGNLYLALTNQASEPIQATLHLNRTLVDYLTQHKIRVWQENKPTIPLTLHEGQFTVEIAAKGITALAIEGVKVNNQLQHQLHDVSQAALPAEGLQEVRTTFGKMTGMIISFGPSLTSAYVWLEVSPEQLQAATLVYLVDGEWCELPDQQYPFEFTVPLKGTEQDFTYYVIGTTPKALEQKTDVVTLHLTAVK